VTTAIDIWVRADGLGKVGLNFHQSLVGTTPFLQVVTMMLSAANQGIRASNGEEAMEPLTLAHAQIEAPLKAVAQL